MPRNTLEQSGFVAGTLVHAKHGLVPIESLMIGDLVLAQPESRGERAYKRVDRTVCHDDQEVCLLQYVVGDETVTRGLVLTADLPLWVPDVWTPAGELGIET